MIRIPVGQWIAAVVDWLVAAIGPVFDVIRLAFDGAYRAFEWILLAPPVWTIVVAISLIALLASGWRLAIGTAIGLLLIFCMNQWVHAMQSLALVLLASLIAIALSVPLGIWAAKSETASKIIRPVLDFMQTMPAFVYLIPALVLFRVGVVPGIVATIIFAMAPGARMTELGIRGVDEEVVEAGRAFGATPGRILRQIQLPLAMPSIMAGLNQVIMLALSMVVIAGMVGAGGLGADVVQSLNRIDIALGFEAGLSVVILAVILDRVTGAFSRRRQLGEPGPIGRLLGKRRDGDADAEQATAGQATSTDRTASADAEALPAGASAAAR